MSLHLRLAIDIGGTFTDTVLADPDGTILASNKVLTTHDDPSSGALAGALRALRAARCSASDVKGVIHGTTLATNALIEKRGARTFTITTAGFRDILEIAYERRYAQYDIALEKPDLLVRRDQCLTVRERMDVHGTALIPLQQKAIEEVLGQIDESVDAVAICLLHAYANPAHEDMLADALRARRPDLRISLSSQVSPEAREFDRLCTTLANAYIQPLMDGYLAQFAARFSNAGLDAPILMMTASGGMCTVETARRFPIRLVESGPAGGATLASDVAKRAGLSNVLSFDMGGTTAKLCLINSGTPRTARSFEVARAARFIKGSGMPVRVPVIDMIEIGAGGGSIAHVDRLGRLQIGPESAGSDPGPAAFGRGGVHPTVTDADVALGYIRPEWFAQGDVSPDREAARRALEADVGSALEISVEQAAQGVSQMVDENMAAAARMHAVESGEDLSTRVMIAFGGNGPLHATRLARAAGITEILVPPDPGVGSAVGFLCAPVSFELVRSRYGLLTEMEWLDVTGMLEAMEREARAVVAQGAPNATASVERVAFMRYVGQGHEIETVLPPGAGGAGWVPHLTDAFEAAYAMSFSRPVPGMEIEILNWAVRASVPGSARHTSVPVPKDAGQAETVSILCDVTGAEILVPVLDRANLAPDTTVPGPALIAETQTTTLVSEDFSAHVDACGNLRLIRKDLQ